MRSWQLAAGLLLAGALVGCALCVAPMLMFMRADMDSRVRVRARAPPPPPPVPAAVFVVGMHHTGTSLLTLLLMNLGLVAGETSDLLMLSGNAVKFFELAAAEKLDEEFLALTSDRTPRWPAYGYEWGRASAAQQREFMARAAEVLAWLDAHAGGRSWVLKDPRLCLLAEAYLSQVETRRRVCVIPHRDPVEVASRFLKFVPDWPFGATLELWEEYNVRALQACRRAGARIVQVSHRQLMARPPEAARALYGELSAAGVAGLAWPGEGGLRRGFLDLWEPPGNSTGPRAADLARMISPRARKLWAAQRSRNLAAISDAELLPTSWARAP